MSFLKSFDQSAQQSDYDNINFAVMYDESGAKYKRYIRQDDGRFRCVSWILDQLAERGISDAYCIDLGCASDVPVSATLAAKGHKVTGVAVSPGQIRLAQERVPAGTFVESDMRSWQPPGDTLGHVVGILTFYSLPHLSLSGCQYVLSLIATWLKEDGLLALGMVNGVSDKVKWVGFDVCATSISVDEMSVLLEICGMEVIRSWEEEWSSTTDKEARSKINPFFCARKKSQS